MKPFPFKRLAALAALTLLAGCAPKTIRVRCDAHLQPINPPTSGSSSGAVDGKERAALKGTRP